ncbi:MAG: tyrosine-type recombinase/integrase [Bdellovibrionaceae bacterium]|nr:tyrosine-type recombinase/integrase [Pseudobdellovibrionaceae bacterium]
MALPLWVDFFDDLQHVRGRSLNTVQAYRRDLEIFDEFHESTKDLSDIYRFLHKKKLSTRTQARVISSIRTYFRFCADRGQKIPDLTQLRPPKVSVSLPQALTIEDFHRLYDASVVEDLHKTARNHITLLLLFGLGCRVSELIQMNLQDLHETESWLKVTGKGNKERLVPVTAQLLGELKAYLLDVRPHLVKDTNTSILINDRGHRPSRVDIWRWLDAWSKKAGFEDTVNPHKFRHGCATVLLEAGADLRSIQKLLGHSSIQTTQIYTSVTTNKMRDTLDEHHPLSGMTESADIDGEI